MTDRRKTALIFGMTSLFMFSPLAMSLFWHPIPLFQNLGYERESIAPPLGGYSPRLQQLPMLFTP